MRRLAVLLLTALAGCLPSGQRPQTRAVTAADSLSIRVAAEAPVDTLRLVWKAEAPQATPFELPTSLVWTGDSTGGGALVVADTRAGSLHVFSPEGAHVAVHRPEGLQYPYLAGARGDTVVVHNRGARRLDFVRGGRVVRRLALPDDFYAVVATDSLLWAKRADDEARHLVRLDAAGREEARFPLPGLAWRHRGFLRLWGDRLLSLSGYRPVVDALPAGAPSGAVPDSLALVGFDSPQLVRSYQFLIGEADEAPLLTSSAAALGERLFVLNLRTDHLRVDVYRLGPEGLRLERALVHLDPEGLAEAFPIDLAVRADGRGGYRFAVLLQNPGGVLSRPGGRLLMLAWDRPPLAQRSG